MKQYLLLIFSVVCITLLAACGPDARYPIDDKPNVKIDERLMGKWIVMEKKDGEFKIDSDIVYTVSKQTDYTYSVFIRAKKNDKYEEDKTTAYLSKVGSARFVNVYIKDEPGGYLFLKILNIDAKAGKITATSLADTMTATNAAQVRELITKNVDNPHFYSDTVFFERKKSK